MKPRFGTGIRENNKHKHLLKYTLRLGPQRFLNFKADSHHVDVCISELTLGGCMYLLLEQRFAARLVSAAASFQNGRRLHGDVMLAEHARNDRVTRHPFDHRYSPARGRKSGMARSWPAPRVLDGPVPCAKQ